MTSCTVIQSKAFVHAASTLASGEVSERSFGDFWSSWWWVFVKGYHVLEFAILTLLLGLWLKRRPIWLIALLAIAYAALDEFHQRWVPDRGGRWTDVLIDAAGILIALGLIAILRHRTHR